MAPHPCTTDPATGDGTSPTRPQGGYRNIAPARGSKAKEAGVTRRWKASRVLWVRGEVKAWVSGYFSGAFIPAGPPSGRGSTRYPSPVNEAPGRKPVRVTGDAPGRRVVNLSHLLHPAPPALPRRHQPDAGRLYPHGVGNPSPSSHSASSSIPSGYARRQPTRLANHNPSFSPSIPHPETATSARPNHTLGSQSESSCYEPTNPGSHPLPPPVPTLASDRRDTLPPWVPSRGLRRPFSPRDPR